MLLVPVDKDVQHKDASYDGRSSGVRGASHSDDLEIDAHRDAVLLSVPALKPSASLLAGEVGFVDEDEDEVGANDEAVPAVSGTYVTQDVAEDSPKEWEDVSRPIALQTEIEAGAQSVATLQAWDDIEPTLSSSKRGNKPFVQLLRGTWSVTMVLRECSVPGTLYLFAESLVFRSELDHTEESSDPYISSHKHHGGQTWRWRLERLTQVLNRALNGSRKTWREHTYVIVVAA